MLADNYIQSVTDIENLTVTDAEITEFLSQFPKEELPPLEEIRTEVEGQIIQQKQQAILTTLIADLRSKSDIEKIAE
jgi:hypothetical protein